ncbi:MAG: dethiobiotin synthase [Limisphaerales bacterium]
MARVVFITGTDTSVGKTAVTALLLAHAQAMGINVRALKPFSTGGVGDEALLGSLQKSSLRINFFHYREPISPWSAAKLLQLRVSIEFALQPIVEHRGNCELLLVEGAGGLLTPLGDGFSAADLISELHAEVILVAANRLGVLNHTLLTMEALRHRGAESVGVALVELEGSDASCKSNLADLTELLPAVPVVPIPFLENYRAEPEFIRSAAKRVQSELSLLLQGRKTDLHLPPSEAAL